MPHTASSHAPSLRQAWRQRIGITWTVLLVGQGLVALVLLPALLMLGPGPGEPEFPRALAISAAAAALLLGAQLLRAERLRQGLWQRRVLPRQVQQASQRMQMRLAAAALAALALPPMLLAAAVGAVALLVAVPAGLALALAAGGLLAWAWPASASQAFERLRRVWRTRYPLLLPPTRRANFGFLIGIQVPLAWQRDPQGFWLAVSPWGRFDSGSSLFATVGLLAMGVALAWDGLRGHQLHWRQLLAPAGLQRQRYGLQILRSTAEAWAWILGSMLLVPALMIGLAGLLLMGLDAASWQQAGFTPDRLRLGLSALPWLAMDLGAGLVVGVWLRGLHGSKLRGWTCLLLALAWLAAAGLLVFALGTRGLASPLVLGLSLLLLWRPLQKAWASWDLTRKPV